MAFLTTVVTCGNKFPFLSLKLSWRCTFGFFLLSFKTIDAFVSYFATIVGLYAAVDAYAILKYGLTSNPLLSALGYLSFVAPAILSIPAAYLENKSWKWLLIVFLILFAVAWLYQAADFTVAHLNPS